jgi:hypothetical protein
MMEMMQVKIITRSVKDMIENFVSKIATNLRLIKIVSGEYLATDYTDFHRFIFRMI